MLALISALNTLHYCNMIYDEDSVNILGDIVKSLTFPVKINSVTGPIKDKYTIETCDMYHAQPGFPVKIGGKNYVITDIVPGSKPDCGTGTKDKLIVSGSNAIAATTFDLYKPFFFHATPIAQGVEMEQKKNDFEKKPMAWLYEQFTDGLNHDPMSVIERTIRFRLFFLTHCDHDTWLTDECYKQSVRPMRRFAQNFIKKIKGMPWRFDVDKFEYNLLNYSKFGVFIENRGMEKKLWHDKLGGVEMSGTLTIFRKEACDECES